MIDYTDPRLLNADYSSTPERRLWMAVLQTFVDDIYYYSRTRSHDKRRRFLIVKSKDEPEDEAHWTDDSIETCMYQANHPHIKEICELINLDHKWFIDNLNRLAKSPEKFTRPRINSW